MQLQQALRAGKLNRSGANAARVEILLDNGQPYAENGRLLFTDLTVDPGTGQVSLRAEVPNPSLLLLPGMYVRARLQQAQVDNAVLLPQQAVTRGSDGDSVMVVNADGTVAPRKVQIAGAKDNQWIVTGGLNPGEKVMVDGSMKLMLGIKVVKPVPWQADPAPSGAKSAPTAPASGASAAAPQASAAAASR